MKTEPPGAVTWNLSLLKTKTPVWPCQRRSNWMVTFACETYSKALSVV